MKILWVTTQLPCVRSGPQVRQWYLLRYLAQRHDIQVVSLLQPHEGREVAPLHALGIGVKTVAFNAPLPQTGWGNRIRSWKRRLADPMPELVRVYPEPLWQACAIHVANAWQPDVVHMEALFTGSLSTLLPSIPGVLQESNVEYELAHRQWVLERRPARRIAGRIEEQKLRRCEQRFIQQCEVCVSVSESDARRLRGIAGSTPVVVAANGVAVEEFARPPARTATRSGLLFFGTLSYRPNIDAVTWFCRDILPLVRQKNPSATFKIIGAQGSAEVAALGDLPGVEYIGFVTDVRPYLWDAATCVVPLRSGGGTRFKILEALAAGCPVISTTLGAEGLDLRPGIHFAQADTTAGLAEESVQLLERPEYMQRLGLQGQEFVRERYDWSRIGPVMEDAYGLAIARHRQRIAHAVQGA